MGISEKGRAIWSKSFEKARAAAIAAKRKRLIKCVCKNCGKEFTKRPSEIKYGMGKFCSRPCRYTYMRSENAPYFKGKRKS